MNKKKYVRKTPEQRIEEIKELSSKALNQIEQYTNSSEDLLEYATFLSKFHNYSPNNTALIHDQFKGAEAVGSFKTWKDKGYSVNKGEKGIKILTYTPITSFKDKEGNVKNIRQATKTEKELIKQKEIKTWKKDAFKIGHVFDVSQTNCPPEELPKVFPNKQFNFDIEDKNNIKYLNKGIEAVANDLKIEIKDMKHSQFGITELGASKGAFVQGLDPEKKEIIMNSRNTETQSLATSIHELAHARLHNMNEKDSEFDRPTKEFQAELTSYIVCKHYGMDTSEKAIPYISSWTKNGVDIEDKQLAIEGVHKTSKEFIDIIDQTISKERENELSIEKDRFNTPYPKDIDNVIYCDVTGKPFGEYEEYYHLAGDVFLSEEAHSVIYTDEEWEQLYEETVDFDDNYEQYYMSQIQYGDPDDEMTDVVPPSITPDDVYYIYNPNDQMKPEKLGTVADIVTHASDQKEFGRFSFDLEVMKDFVKYRNNDKEEFNEVIGSKYNLIKNPDFIDFQKINERFGLEKDANLDKIRKEMKSESALTNQEQKRQAYMRQRGIER